MFQLLDESTKPAKPRALEYADDPEDNRRKGWPFFKPQRMRQESELAKEREERAIAEVLNLSD